MTQLPKFKKRCIKCEKFAFIKSGWNYCMACWEKSNGRYKGEDRHLFVKK